MYFQLQLMYSCETVWVKVLISKGMALVRIYSTNTIMEKNKQRWNEGGGLRIWNFQ